MGRSAYRLGSLVIFSFLAGVVVAQEKMQGPSPQNKESVEKQSPAVRAVIPPVADAGTAQKSNPATAAKEPEPVKTKSDTNADAEKTPNPPARNVTPIKRDPFRPFTLNARGNSARRRESLSPLERYELGQLKLVGVIWDVKEPNAMVEDATGLGYRIKVGTPIGANEGKVKMIERDGIVVEEFQIDPYGAKTKREVKIRLSPEKAE
ncbi:MAG TPA: pilus assembly protein PilP [Methylomirabilota bacterium]|nr:pilus assembly protein PilP [Methylomirabilota bacterium]